MHTLTNDHLSISIRQPGAELCKITSVKDGTEYMWHGDPNVWSGIAPTLFPIVGALKDERYKYKGKTYEMYKHGFFRKSNAIVVVAETESSITYKLTSHTDTLEVYPFDFEFYITYTLEGNDIIVDHEVVNTDHDTMHFSLGGHPAFKCPVYDGEAYADYQLVFEHNEIAKTHLLNLKTGLYTGETETVFNNNSTIDLHYNLFNKDALVFKDLKSRKVTLNSKTHGAILTIDFKDFKQLGIWAKPNANYVCIEPWLGYADNETTDQEFSTKAGSLSLEAGKVFEAKYIIAIH